jgi:hypothetical protein
MPRELTGKIFKIESHIKISDSRQALPFASADDGVTESQASLAGVIGHVSCGP